MSATNNPTVVTGEGGQRDGATTAVDLGDQQGYPNYGPWMIVTKHGRPRLSKEGGNQGNYGKNQDGSRFSVLINKETTSDKKKIAHINEVNQARSVDHLSSYRHRKFGQTKTNPISTNPRILPRHSQHKNQPLAMQPHADVNVQMDHHNKVLKQIKNKAAKNKHLITLNLSKQKTPLDPTKHTVINLDEIAQYTSKPSSSVNVVGINSKKRVEVGM